MAANTVWGLDIGNSAIKVVKMVRTTDSCKVVDFDIVDIPVGEDDKDRPARVQQAMANVTKGHKFGGDPVYVAISGNVCLHREFQLPPGSEDKLGDLVQYEAKQQIPFPLEQVEWGYERYDDPNGVGVALIAVRKNDIQDLITLCENMKLNIRGITASPLALFNFVHYEFNPDSTTLILDSGAKGTDFVVMNKRQIYFRTIQIAGRELTKVLENKFKVPYEKAEDLKKNISKSPQADKILAVIEPTLRQLGAEVQRTIGFYKSRAKGQRISQCYLLGHTFRLPKMAEYLQAQVREAPFAVVEGLQRIKLDHTINSDVWNNEFPTMTVAIGLGLQGLELSELKLNLIPKAKRAEIARGAWKPWIGAAAALVMATLYFSKVQAEKGHEKMAGRLEALEKSDASMRKNDAQEAEAIAGLPEMEVLARRYARIGHDRGKLAQIFPQLAALQRGDGAKFFGPEAKVFLTGLYVSRIPPGMKGGLPEILAMTNLKGKEILEGRNSLYAPLGNPKTADPLTLPAELRPDVPLLAVMTCEVENTANLPLQMQSQLEDALKKIPEVKEFKIERVDPGPAYIEPELQYSYEEGTLKTSAVGAGAAPPPGAVSTEKKRQFTWLYAIMRWEDPGDPDLAPVEVAAPAPKAAPKAPAKK